MDYPNRHNRLVRPFVMPYTQFVEVGRIVVICLGQQIDKLAVIVDIVDDKRVVVDFVDCEEPRQTIPIKRFKLTDFTVKIVRAAATQAVKEAVKAEGISKKFFETKWGQRILRNHAQSNLTDFSRFKHERLVLKREEIVAKELAKH